MSSSGDGGNKIDHDNAAIPELLQVFREAHLTKINSEMQTFLNSWLMAGLVHPSDDSVRRALKDCPGDEATVQWCLDQLDKEAHEFKAFRSMHAEQRKVLAENQARILQYIHAHLDFDTPDHIRSLSRAAVFFSNNGYLAKRWTETQPTESEKRDRFQHGFSPFVTLHTAAHLMDIIGRSLEDKGQPDAKVDAFRGFLRTARLEKMPLQIDSYNTPENITLGAVRILRSMQIFLKEIYNQPLGNYLPYEANGEKILVKNLFNYLQPYRPVRTVRPFSANYTDNVVKLDFGA